MSLEQSLSNSKLCQQSENLTSQPALRIVLVLWEVGTIPNKVILGLLMNQISCYTSY